MIPLRTAVLFVMTGATLLTVLSGCFSSMVNTGAGGEMIWWCDITQSRIGSPDTHVPGMTKYDPEKGIDVPMAGVSEEELAEIRAEKAKRKDALASIPSKIEAKKTPLGWVPLIGRKSKEERPEESSEKVSPPKEEKSWIPFRNQKDSEDDRKASTDSSFGLSQDPATPQPAEKKSRWKIWQR